MEIIYPNDFVRFFNEDEEVDEVGESYLRIQKTPLKDTTLVMKIHLMMTIL